ncbi:3'-5' exonuclease [Proteiniphilum sp. X52]|uniref:3'-5' exonuclease n=1 Tax=Proteiniphilum sp. X52 TaxID=2382159 RepID=UPI000F0A3758|nr:3'-5' exonuclease [Proteiniphilum sp. X52]RNC67000.1 hypothetical protein D7D25_01755 [Proteiniphilum sp. X52]
MTFLGDFNQSLNPYTKNDITGMLKIFPYADLVCLNNSYRSTYEIVNFAQKIFYNKDLIAIERHGELPVIQSFNNSNDEIEEIIKRARGFCDNKKYSSLAIICKNDTELFFLSEKFKKQNVDIYLLDSNCTTFSNGVILTNAYLSKGLEFDSVIIPFVNKSNYKNDIDRSMLYISCTRAMHQLVITHTDEISPIIKNGISEKHRE